MADTERITLNMSVVDLGRIDLLVEAGFYASRSDFIRSAIRKQLAEHADTVQEHVVRRSAGVGIMAITRRELEKARAEGAKVSINVVGMAIIGNDVTPELARATIESVQVFGVLRAPEAVKKVLANLSGREDEAETDD